MVRSSSKIVLGLSILSAAGMYSLIAASSALAAPRSNVVQSGFEQWAIECAEVPRPAPRPRPTPPPRPNPNPHPYPTPSDPPTQVPEPATTAALVLSAVGMLGLRKKK